MRRSRPPLTGFETVPSLVSQLEPQMRRRSDDELRTLTGVFRQRIRAVSEVYPTGLSSEDLDPEALDPVRLERLLTGDAKRAYDARRARLSASRL